MRRVDANPEDESSVQLITFGKRDHPPTSPSGNNANNHNHNHHSLSANDPSRGGRNKSQASYDEPWSQHPALFEFELDIKPPSSNGAPPPAYQDCLTDHGGSPTTDQDPFLPVKLDPGLDGSSASTPTSSDTSKLIRELEKHSPPDRYHMIYIIMLIHGIAVLIPWNMFINAKAYFQEYKLNQGNESSEALQDYRINFMSYVGMASQYPSFIMNIINLFAQCGGNTLGIRILTGIISSVIIFIATVVLAMLDTDDWPETFFWITMVSVVILNAAAGIYQNSMFGLVAILPMKYTNAVVFGNNLSGTFVAILNLVVLSFASDHRTSAIYYFVVAIVVLMVAFDAYFLTSHSKFYRHYSHLHELKEREHREAAEQRGKKMTPRVLMQSFAKVFTKIWHLLFGIWFTFFITLALFPAVMSDVRPLQVEMDNTYWSGIFCFLFFNLFASIGNLTTEFIKWPGAKWINVLIILRVVFVPLMVLGNFRPELRTMPVYLGQDWLFIISAILFSFTSGYCSSLVMMYAPKLVPPNLARYAGMMMGLGLTFGILCGINFSRLFGKMVGAG